MVKREFSSLGGGGRVFHSPHLTLRVYSTPHMVHSRFSFIVSKKVSKKSVTRNKLKRIGYRAIKLVSPDIKNGVSCLFFLKSGAEQVPHDQLSKEMVDILKKSGVFL